MKIDLHCHTYFSNDGISSPEKIIKQALLKGLDGVAITDHETSAGWAEAQKAGQKLGAQIILGEEIKTKQGDVLAIFIQQQINGKGKDARLVINEIKKQGGLAIIPHPYQGHEKFKDDLKNYLDIIDGLEVFNARLPFRSADQKAFQFAKQHNLAMTAGSDAHFYKGAGEAYTECQAKTLEEFKNELKNKKSATGGKKASLFYLIFPTLKRLKIINSRPNR
ncbi:MAG TPA: PHP domain-containing protein [Candidatus Pacearchaeota archaeon]|nr:PHP domain-containing protein [Candidatus Pacearchaeota archaeon]HQG09285.1 PHP domain-containing protein [Candidatus Pacearchaeota archaeon]HQH19970.1 PHP domain-containing protein [Candidatus Pacearchaeota archaeon]HQK58434.1 PHP domain-containing protein [Candidatus Pacearchaeota archaeon]